MLQTRQTTVASPFTVTGQGLHEGTATTVRVLPAAATTGFVFRRIDLEGAPEVPFRAEFLGEAKRRTQLQRESAIVHTCEHLIAGLFGNGCDNAIIELDGEEPPAGDGSAEDFSAQVLRVGLTELDAPRRVVRITKPVSCGSGPYTMVALPGEGFAVDYTLDYHASEIPVQHYHFQWSAEAFAKEIAPARTFCLESEANALREKGFGKGANTQNTLVVGEGGRVLENSLRWPDEFVRHKILDVIGDLALAGCRIEGRIVATRSGHSLNHELAREILRVAETPNSKPAAPPPPAMDHRRILEFAPHRYPFLMVDRVLEIADDRMRVVGIKNVTFNEPYFMGHFPEMPVMPGVMQIEAMAQVGGLLTMSMPENSGKVGFLTAVDNARFKKAIYPGDQMRIEARILRSRRGLVEAECECTVDGQLCSMATVKFVVAAKE